jgi:2-polyprenyl-3-methyl-5-hydroxy-6-metoxy-1,4-benzoquinol methylase
MASSRSRDLLPSTAQQFSKQSYWEQFFGKRGAAAFEWYGEWKDLHEHVEPHLSASSRVLVIGCGNSDFSEQMWANGHRNILSIDYSEIVIKQMRAKSLVRHGGTQPQGLRYETMDLHDIKAPAGSFDVIMDKACLDALVTDPSLGVFRDVSAMIDETLRVLTREGGKYICVTLAQTHVLKFLLTKFALGWEGVVTHAVSVEAQASLSSFVFVFTRAAAEQATAPTTLTVDLDETDSMFGDDKTQNRTPKKKTGSARDVSHVELGLEDSGHARPRATATETGRPGPAGFRFGGQGMMARPASSTAAAPGDDAEVATVRLAAFEKVASRLDGARKMLYAQKELKQLQFSGP